MIEPLRFNREEAPPLAVTRPVWCSICLASRKLRANPNYAVKHCVDCADRTKKFFCLSCDESFHRVGAPKSHRRRILVLGAGVRKTVVRRGDAVNFPLLLDYVTIRCKATIYHANKIIYKEKKSNSLKFFTGLSGACVHIQVLGAKNLVAADGNGSSNAYVVAMYSGKKLGYTRVRPKTLNPKWINETFIVPTGIHLQDPRDMARSQKGLFRLEVYNYTMVGSSDFLGHVEIDKAKLTKMAHAAKQQPILLPLTTREFHGYFRPQFGVDSQIFTIKAVSAECLDKINPLAGTNPYVRLYFGEQFIGSSTPVFNTVDPQWTTGNEFRLKINEVMRMERKLLTMRKDAEERSAAALKTMILNRKSAKIRSVPTSGSAAASEPSMEEIAMENDPKNFMMFRFEVMDYNMFRPHDHMGTVLVSVDDLRELCPGLPRRLVVEREPTRQDQIDEAYRRLLNPVKGSFFSACFSKKRAVETAEVEDDDFWVNNIEEREPVLSLDLENDDDSLSLSTTKAPDMRRRNATPDFQLASSVELSSKNLGLLSKSQSESLSIAGSQELPGSSSLDGTADQQLDIEDPRLLVTDMYEDDDAPGADDRAPLLGHPISSSARRHSLCERLVAFLTFRKAAATDVDEDDKADPIEWGRVGQYDVEQESKKNVAESSGSDRGHLVLRLIAANRGYVLQGLDEGVRHMSLGETADLKVRWDQAYANYCQGGNIPARSNIVFRVELQTINGWGKIGMPIRVAKRIFRFTTWSCKYAFKMFMRSVREARRKKRCLVCCRALSSYLGLARKTADNLDELVDQDDDEKNDGDDESSDEDDDAPVVVNTVKLSNRMKKLVTGSAVAGTKYLFNYHPKPPPVQQKKKKKRLATIQDGDEEGGDDDDGNREDKEGEEGGEEEKEEREGGEDWDGNEVVGDDNEDPMWNAQDESDVAGGEAGGSSSASPTPRERECRPVPPTLSAFEASLLPDPSTALGSSRSHRSNNSSGSEAAGGEAVPRPQMPPPEPPHPYSHPY